MILVARRASTKLLVMTTFALTYVVFAFYTAVLTSEMTVLPPPFTIKSLEDVIDYDYQIMVHDGDFVYQHFATSDAGSVERRVFEQKIRYIQERQFDELEMRFY